MKRSGSVTIIDVTDISNIVNYYLTTNLSTGVTTSTPGWTEQIQTVTEEKPYLWTYTKTFAGTRLVDTTTPIIIGTFGRDGAAGNSVSDIEIYYVLSDTVPTQSTVGSLTVPEYTGHGTYYKRIKIYYAEGDYSFGDWCEDEALTQQAEQIASAENAATAAAASAQAAEANTKYLFLDNNGMHLVQGLGTFDKTNSDTYGFNTLLGSGGIFLRYNAINLACLSGSALTFYNPITHAANAILDKDGLILSKGGIVTGTVGQSGFVYLSSDDYGTQLTIGNGTNKTDWKAIIGTNFGVDSGGDLYASNAHISGEINASSGNIGGCVIDNTGKLIVPAAQINGSLTIESDTYSASDYVRLSAEDSQSISIGNSGNKTDWRILAGNSFGVDKAGNLYSTSANISGLITATGGSIGAWSIESPTNGSYTYGGALYTGTFGSSGGVYLTPGYTTTSNIGGSTGNSNKTWVITAGDGFGITSDGSLYANSANISGFINANTGTIGGSNGWTIESQKLSSGIIGTDDSMVLSTKNLAGTVAGTTFSDSGLLTSGWRLTIGSNFGVDNTGKIYATGGTIGGCVIDNNGRLQITDLNVTGKLTADSLNVNSLSLVSSNMGTLTSGTITYGTVGSSQSFYLSNTSATATINGVSRSGLRFTIGSKFGVDYNGNLYADGAYITNINTSGITVSEIYYNSTHKVTIDSNGMNIYNGSSSNPVAQYGASFFTTNPIQFGASAGTTFKIKNIQKKIGLKHGNYKNYTQSMSLNNYYPLGIIGWNFDGPGSTNLLMSECFLSSKSIGSTTISFRLRNIGASADCNTSSTLIKIKVLWVYCGTNFSITDTDDTVNTDTEGGSA